MSSKLFEFLETIGGMQIPLSADAGRALHPHAKWPGDIDLWVPGPAHSTENRPVARIEKGVLLRVTSND